VKITETDALWPAAMVLGRDSPVRWNSELVEVADEIVTLDPAAARFIFRTLLVPTGTLPKFNALMLEVNSPVETPLADSAMARFGFAAFEATAIFPRMFPAVLAVKITLKVMLCPLARVTGRGKPLVPNGPPVTFTPEMVTAELPVLVSVSN
jgi:hypothetical protein